MKTSEIAPLRERLERMKAELEDAEESAEESTRTVELDHAKQGRLTRMDALQGQQMALETSRRRKRLLRRIEGAFRRIEDGDYGDCARCGEPIANGRLEADPTATRCVECAEE